MISHDVLLALQVTAVGMSLVFGAIGLLWLMMVLLVRLTADRVVPPTVEKGNDQAADSELRRQAAVAAVAVALAQATLSAVQPGRFTPPPTSSVSAWQGVMRGRQLKQRGRTR